MFTVFAIEKDSNGIERVIRKGKSVSSKEYGEKKLERYPRGFLMDIGNFKSTGFHRIESFIQAGCTPVKIKGMESCAGVLEAHQFFGKL